jgi:hypothetical protein
MQLTGYRKHSKVIDKGHTAVLGFGNNKVAQSERLEKEIGWNVRREGGYIFFLDHVGPVSRTLDAISFENGTRDLF